jgi:methionine-rich copper-binding protein CopC
MKRILAVIAVVLGFAFAPAATADITVSSTSPTAGSSLTVGPNVVSITASVPLVDQGSLIVVNDPNGTAVDDGSIAVNGNTIIVGMKPLTVTGVYTVTYTLISDQNPELMGNYTFMYNAPGTISSPVAKPSATSGTQVVDANNATSNAVVYFLLFLAALVAIFLVWYAKATFGGAPKRKKATTKKAK